MSSTHRTTPAVLILLIATILTTATGASSLTAQERELTLAEIVAGAPDWNLAVRRAVQTVEEARADLDARPGRDSTTLILSGDYRDAAPAPWTAGSSLRVDPLPQLGLSGGVDLSRSRDDEVSAEPSLSATVSPLEPHRPTWSQERAYRSALIRLDDARRNAQATAEAAALKVLLQRRQLNLARRVLDLREDEYDVEQRRRAIGDASFRDVQDRLAAQIDARRAVFSAQQQLLRDETDLRRAVTLAGENVAVAPLTTEELRDMLARREAEAAGSGAEAEAVDGAAADANANADEPLWISAPVSTADLELARVALEALEAERAATPLWRPDLSLSAGITFPPEGASPSPAAGVELRVSPAQGAARQRRELDQQITLQRLEVASQRAEADLQRDLVRQSIEIGREALAAAEVQRDRDAAAVTDAATLVDRGALSPLELRQLEINLMRSEIAVFQAVVDLYSTLGDALRLRQ